MGPDCIGRWLENQHKITIQRVEYPYGGHFLYQE